MNGLTQTATAELPADSDILELTDGENPLKFLNSSEKHLPLAMIRGIDDTDRLEGYRLAETRYFDPPRDTITDALSERERELTGESTAPTPEPETADPVPATDGGQAVETEAPDDVHPDTKGLVAGEVLVLEHADRTDYIFPATTESDEPYLLRAFDGDDERTDEPLGLTFDEVKRRTDGESATPIAEIDVRAPRLAASNGGDS